MRASWEEKSESKGEGKEEDWIEVRAVHVSPNKCPVGDPLRLEVEFDALRPIDDGRWKVSFLVDTVDARHIVHLGETKPRDYVGRDCFFDFQVDEIEVADVEPSTLANCGLLVASLHVQDEEVVKIQMVVEVTRDSRGGLIRTLYTPL